MRWNLPIVSEKTIHNQAATTQDESNRKTESDFIATGGTKMSGRTPLSDKDKEPEP